MSDIKLEFYCITNSKTGKIVLNLVSLGVALLIRLIGCSYE